MDGSPNQPYPRTSNLPRIALIIASLALIAVVYCLARCLGGGNM